MIYPDAPDVPRDSPRWWLKALDAALLAEQPEMQTYRDLVDGKHARPLSTETSLKFARIAGLVTTNLCELVIGATAERMAVEGFRFGSSPDADADAWRIWQASDFDAGSADAITHALTYRRGPISVDPNGGDPRLYVEDPRQVKVAYSSDGRRQRVAALKRWQDEWTGEHFATLYLPRAIYKYRTAGTAGQEAIGSTSWQPRLTDGPSVVRNTLGVIPIFELRNRIAGRTVSEIAQIVVPQARLNHAIFNTDAVAEYGAFRQKWASGVEVATDPTTGKAIEPYEASIAKMFVAGTGAAFGDFGATDLAGYLALAQSIASHIARITRIPLPYFMTDGVSNVSAETLALLVSGLVAKCKARVLGYEPAIEDAMRLAFAIKGDARANVVDAETRWASMEIRSIAQDADAALKLTSGDRPVITPQTAQERYLGMSQIERDRDEAWRIENDAVAGLANLAAALGDPAGTPIPTPRRAAPPAPTARPPA